MLEHERKYQVDLGALSPYAIGRIAGVCQITDYYLAPEAGDATTAGPDGVRVAPTCRVRRTTDSRGEHLEITIKRPTSDPLTREEYSYPVPAGSLTVGAEVPRVSKTRYRVLSLRPVLVGVIGGRMDYSPPHARASMAGAPAPAGLAELVVPEAVKCTLDVFSHPPGEPPVLEIEGTPDQVSALADQLAALPWLVERGPGAPSSADRARPLR